MRFFKHLVLTLVLLASVELHAQYEIIFSQYQMSPLTLNPALTGAYEGTYRVGGIARRQWNVGNSTYATTSAFADAPLLMIGKRHWIGAGLMMYSDQAAVDALPLRQGNISLSGAFHYALDKKYKNVFTFGLKFGGSNFRANDDGGVYRAYEDLKNNTTFQMSTLQPVKFLDIAAGVMLKSKIDKKSNVTVGLSVGHLNAPQYGIFKTTGPKLPPTTTFHLDYSRDLNKKLSLMPSFLFRTIAGSKDATVQARVGYKLDPVRKPDLVLNAGVGFRALNNYNNIAILLGGDYKNAKFTLAYDIPRGDLATYANNTLELALHYTGKVYKKPNAKGAHFCPKY